MSKSTFIADAPGIEIPGPVPESVTFVRGRLSSGADITEERRVRMRWDAEANNDVSAETPCALS